MAKTLNEAKVWAEEWAEEHIFKLGRERFQQQFIEAELGKEYVGEVL